EEVGQAGRIALRLRETLETPPAGTAEWPQYGLPADLGIGIALHAGPVFSILNPLTRQICFTGRNVDLAGYLESVTQKGEILTTEAFSILATVDAPADFFCEYMGGRSLPNAPAGVKLFRLIKAE